MIPREGKWFLLTIWTCLLIGEVITQGERAYDTSEWIPITPKPLQASGSEIIEQKTASDRVLSLDAPAQKFFRDDGNEFRQQRPNQIRQFQRELPAKNGFEHPRPRKLKHPSEYKFETPPPPPSKNQPEINYYTGENVSPYTFEQTLQPARPISQQQNQQAYYVPVQQLPKQSPVPDTYVAVPSVNPQVPAVNAPSHYEKFQLPFNNSFYESLSPASINNDFYQAVSNHSNQQIQSNFPISSTQLQSTISTPAPKTSVEPESVQLVYVPVENLKPTHPATQDSKPRYQNIDAPKREKIPFPVSSPQIDEVSLTYKPLEQSNYKPLEQQTYKTLEQSAYKPLEQPNYKPLKQSVYKPLEQPTYKPLEKPKQEKFIYNTVTLPQNQKDVYPQQVDNPRQEKLIALPPVANIKQQRLQSIEQDFIQQALQAHKLQEQLRDDINPLKQDLTANTDKPKRRPHQPPLAVFLESQKKAEISDVLNILRGAKTISVQDAVTPQSPQIFIGPSNLDSPDGYTKFPLPYLNNINGNRIERKIDQLPFFVAPVSYKAPPGYSKISLPSPHVGSVVVSVPIASTTPAPILHNQNQLNPFTFSSPGYSPLDLSQSLRPQENILGSYDILDPSRNQYQSTPTPQVTESPLIPPVRDVYESAFEPRQPNIYYTQPQNHQTYNENVPTLNIFRPQIQENQKYPTREETSKPQPTVSTVNPKEDSRQQSQLPDLNPLELAINEFELHQINDQFEEHNKVKHSTTRRPQTSYDVDQSISNTRSPQTRGRHTYETEPTTERAVTRGKVRGRGRGSVSRTTTTTTTTTTAAPAEADKYTVLEEFVAREQSRAPTTEAYSGPSAEAATVPPRRPTESFSANPYLPQESFESARPHTDFRSSRPQVFDDSNSPSQYENPREEIAEQEQPKRQPIPNSRPQVFDDSRSQIQYKNPREELAELEQPKGQSTSNSRPQPFEDSRSQIQYENPREETADLEPPTRQPTLRPVKSQKPQAIHQYNQFYPDNVEIESFPANVYNLGQPQTHENTDFESPRVSPKSTKQVYENVKQSKNVNTEASSTEKPKLEEATPAPTNFHRFSPEPISYENREPNQRRPQERPNYQQYENINNDARDVKPVFQTDAYQQPPTKVRDQVIDEPKSKPKQQSEENLSGFIDNLFQPNFDQTYISLQDQAVRSLLVPNLLAPSIKQGSPSTSTANEEIITVTAPIIEIPSSTEVETTTTTRAARTRGRGRARAPTTPSSITSATRRLSSRRRPVSRTSGERVSSSTEYTSREDNGRSGSNVKQKFKTRGRPTSQNEISDRVSTTENDVRVFKEPIAQGGFEASREPPQSYMQFEHSIDEQQVITINPNLNEDLEITQYQQLYNFPQQTTTEGQILEYDNTRVGPSPILDVQVSHVIPDDNERRSEISSKVNVEEIPSRYNNANIKSGGVLINNKPEPITNPPPTRARGRTRGRSRFATSTSTSRPVTRIATRPTSVRTTTQNEEKEIYGFTRQPNYTPSNLNIQAPKAAPSNLRNDEPSIQFVGEIRPKYNHRLTTVQPTDELDAVETPRTKTRTRTRAPARKTSSNYRQSDNDVHTAKGSEVVTRRSGTATRTRGRTHYRAPENVKRESDDEDVANQNYPANFLQKLDVSSAKPTTASFQITIDPLDDETDDQSPYSSLYRPKFVPKPNEWFDPNGLPIEDKSEKISESKSTEAIQTSKDPQALAFIHTTENSQQLLNEFSEIDKVMADLEKIKTSPTGQDITTEESDNKKETRRRGIWKLVKQRPVDQLEVSESQNYQTVLNAFDSIKKVDPYSNGAANSEKSATNSKYSNKELSNTNFNEETNSFSSIIDNSFKNDNTQEDIEDIVTITTNSETKDAGPITETNTEDVFTIAPSTTKTQENIFDTIYEMFGIFDKQNKKNNETSLNESVNSYVATTTVDYPTFPEEITEVPTTTTTEKFIETSKIVVHSTEKYNNQDSTPEKNNHNDIVETTETSTSTTLEVKSSTKPYEVEPWKMREVKTSTSTEVSHETEICYKGRCVKSKDKKKRT